MWPGWTPQIGNIGRKQIEELVNKFSNENPKNSEAINENQNKNQSFNDLKTIDIGFHKELPKSRGFFFSKPLILSKNKIC